MTAAPGVVFGTSGSGSENDAADTGSPAGETSGSDTADDSAAGDAAASGTTTDGGVAADSGSGSVSTTTQTSFPLASTGSDVSTAPATLAGVIEPSSEQNTSSGNTYTLNEDPFLVSQPVGAPAPAGSAVVAATMLKWGADATHPNGTVEAVNTSIVQGEVATASFELASVNGVDNVPVAFKFYDTAPNSDCTPCEFKIDVARLDEHDGFSDFAGTGSGLNWGRWDGTATITEGGTAVASVPQHHGIYSPNPTAWSDVPSSGTALFQHVGGTAPSDEAGTLGTMNSGTVLVDFGNMNVTSAAYQMTFYSGTANQRVYTAGITGTVSFSEAFDPNQGLPLGGTCTGGACGAGKTLVGSSNMIFIGPSAEGLLSGVSVTTTDGQQGATAVGVLQQTSTVNTLVTPQ
jgi:hypothetical protein